MFEKNTAIILKPLISLLFTLISLTGFSKTWSDSLWNNFNNSKLPDSVRLSSISRLIYKYYSNYDSDSTILLCHLHFDLASELNNKKHQAIALVTEGQAFYKKGDNLKALELAKKSLKISDSINDKKAMGNTLCNIGNVFLQMGNYANAVDHYTQSMKLAEEVGNKNLVATNLANIGIIAFSQGDYDKAMDYNSRNLKIMEELNDKYSLGYSYRNIGKVYEVKKDYQKAIHAYTKSYNYSKEAEDENGMSYSLSYLGNVYQHMKVYDKALEYFERSLALSEKMNDTYGIAENLNNIGNCYFELNSYPKAIEYCKRSYDISAKTELVLLQRNAAQSLYEIYKRTGDHKQALYMHEQFTAVKDTLLSEENRKGVLQKEIQYKYEKQSLSDSLAFIQKQKLNEIEHAQQLEHEKNQRYILYGGLFFALTLGAVAFSGYRQKKRDNEIIASQKKMVEFQKDIVEVKQKEIIDSISYAKRIQSAILPPEASIKKTLPDSFVYYKPKDIVAGDFYWLEVTEKAGQKLIFLAAADCTGHGVPGALVSVVCSNALNRAVKEFGLIDPGQILDKTRELVIETFSRSEEEVKDGMDISLCCIPVTHDDHIKIHWSGANNPIWISRKDTPEELLEIKGDKQPIGYFTNSTPFTTHTIDLVKGDSLYLFTDGFQDQFGESSGKKFKSAQMRKLFVSLQEKTMDEQKAFIERSFKVWKGNFEQVDDICIIGVRL